MAPPTILVLGAGINAAAVARELALSGVNVIVTDRGDLASGTTAWSTRLIHGGLRYLEYGEFDLVRESLAERERLVRLAPHLVRPLEFVIPLRGRLGGLLAGAARLAGWEKLADRLRGGRGRGGWTVGIGLSLYDFLARGTAWPRHRLTTAGRPGLPRFDAGRFPLAATYFDAQLRYPERLTVEMLLDAEAAAAATGASFQLCLQSRVTRLAGGRFRVEATSPDSRGQGALELEPDAVINATGAWVDETLHELEPEMGGLARRRLISGTKGSHLLIRHPTLRQALGDAGIYAEACDGRPVFVLPFGPETVLVGTTDIRFRGPPDQARTDAAEIDYLLAAVAVIFPQASPTHADVMQHYCGVRPLPDSSLATQAGTPGAITRRHLLVREPSTTPPLWSIVGGKLTTCRSLAAATAVEILHELGGSTRGSSVDRPLPGSVPASAVAAIQTAVATAARQAGCGDSAAAVAESCFDLFGGRSMRAWAPARLEAVAAAGLPVLIPGLSLPTAAVLVAVDEEWAQTLDDVVDRRLMMLFEPTLSIAALQVVAGALVIAGRLAAEDASGVVCRTVERLRIQYGKQVFPEPDAAVTV